MRRERTLLLLDGMEPLQSSNDFERGKVQDYALATLITELARENPGLCVITTREKIADLDVTPALAGDARVARARFCEWSRATSKQSPGWPG